ncbi:hypothetical protein [Vibrio parahaemolyticus]|uniref:hypothetical protein n=1 Tax=Vibrio parahaemolyticus TaxID=670 RepID=UPI00387A9887
MINLFDVMEKEIRPFITGVPEFVSRPAMSSALYDFCEDSGAWTEDQVLGAYDNDIILYPKDPFNSAIIGVEWVKRHGGSSCYAHTFRADKVVLEFVPNAEVDVRIKLANNRISDSMLVPDWMFNQHQKAITHLTVHKLMVMDGKPWANAQGAAYHYQKYREYLGGIVIKATPKSVKMRPFI